MKDQITGGKSPDSKERADLEQRAQALVTDWRVRMGLDAVLKIDVEVGDLSELSREHGMDSCGSAVTIGNEANTEFKIIVDPRAEGNLRHIIIHELVHVHTFSQSGNDPRENMECATELATHLVEEAHADDAPAPSSPAPTPDASLREECVALVKEWRDVAEREPKGRAMTGEEHATAYTAGRCAMRLTAVLERTEALLARHPAATAEDARELRGWCDAFAKDAEYYATVLDGIRSLVGPGEVVNDGFPRSQHLIDRDILDEMRLQLKCRARAYRNATAAPDAPVPAPSPAPHDAGEVSALVKRASNIQASAAADSEMDAYRGEPWPHFADKAWQILLELLPVIESQAARITDLEAREQRVRVKAAALTETWRETAESHPVVMLTALEETRQAIQRQVVRDLDELLAALDSAKPPMVADGGDANR